MGRVSEAWIETCEQGWYESDKFVCELCFEDPYLKEVIEDNLEFESCNYCNSSSQAKLAAPLDCILQLIFNTFQNYYSSPEASGVPRANSSWAIPPISTEEALCKLPLNVESDELFIDIADHFINDSWIPTAKNDWALLHDSDLLNYTWERFCNEIKYKSRYFFTNTDSNSEVINDYQEMPVLSLLNEIGSWSETLQLIRPILADSNYYRVRKGFRKFNYNEVGPPPAGVAGNGRMNPDGISYFYLADNIDTAISETRLSKEDNASLATFKLLNELKVLDFSIMVLPYSKFIPGSYGISEAIKFWTEFQKQIQKPVSKKSSLEYIPTQVLSEYFAKIFKCKDGSKIDGFIYESTLSNGSNLVLFPESCKGNDWEHNMLLTEVKHFSIWNSEN